MRIPPALLAQSLLLATNTFPATCCVDIHNTAGPWDGASWPTAFRTIQEAVNAASAGWRRLSSRRSPPPPFYAKNEWNLHAAMPLMSSAQAGFRFDHPAG